VWSQRRTWLHADHLDPRRRTRGEIETLRSGSLRVRVYAGIDRLSKKRDYLVETVPAGPGVAREATRPIVPSDC
jgi:hypothetical protein